MMQAGNWRTRSAALALALAATMALGATGIVVARGDDDQNRAPRTDQVNAVLNGVDRTKVQQTVCRGSDPPGDTEYREALETFRGTSSGGSEQDPTLFEGNLTVTVRSLINRTARPVNGQEGTVEGTVVVRDRDTGKRKVEAKFFATSGNLATLEGVLVGKANPRGMRGAGDTRLLANLSGRFDAMDNEVDFTNVSIGEESSDDSTINPAVTQSGECPGGPGAPRALGGERDDD